MPVVFAVPPSLLPLFLFLPVPFRHFAFLPFVIIQVARFNSGIFSSSLLVLHLLRFYFGHLLIVQLYTLAWTA